MGEAVVRTKRLYLRKTDDVGKQEIWRCGEQIGTIFFEEDQAGHFWAWNVFFDGRFGGSSQTRDRPATLHAALTEARAWVKSRTREMQPA